MPEFGKSETLNTTDGSPAECIPFTGTISETAVNGKAAAIWAKDHFYLLFVVTDQEWDENEFDDWYSSIALNGSKEITFAVDMESDGAFYGVNQSAQKYTINRIFDEEKFTYPKTGHGWAAERGNNLIDNLKGFVKGQHSTIIGDDNEKNGADRVTTFSDGSRLLIQTSIIRRRRAASPRVLTRTDSAIWIMLRGNPWPSRCLRISMMRLSST